MKILVVDDHTLFREGLAYVLNGYNDDMQIFEAADYDSALKKISDCSELDLVLLDLNMPGKDGFAALRQITQQYSALPVAIISASKRAGDMQRALDMGALGYIPKDSTSAVMLSALQLIFSGGTYVPNTVSMQAGAVSSANELSGLTTRQLDVLNLLARGYSNKIIAAELNLAEATIKMHISAIFKALNVVNRTQAVLLATEKGLINPVT